MSFLWISKLNTHFCDRVHGYPRSSLSLTRSRRKSNGDIKVEHNPAGIHRETADRIIWHTWWVWQQCYDIFCQTTPSGEQCLLTRQGTERRGQPSKSSLVCQLQRRSFTSWHFYLARKIYTGCWGYFLKGEIFGRFMYIVIQKKRCGLWRITESIEYFLCN